MATSSSLPDGGTLRLQRRLNLNLAPLCSCSAVAPGSTPPFRQQSPLRLAALPPLPAVPLLAAVVLLVLVRRAVRGPRRGAVGLALFHHVRDLGANISRAPVPTEARGRRALGAGRVVLVLVRRARRLQHHLPDPSRLHHVFRDATAADEGPSRGRVVEFRHRAVGTIRALPLARRVVARVSALPLRARLSRRRRSGIDNVNFDGGRRGRLRQSDLRFRRIHRTVALSQCSHAVFPATPSSQELRSLVPSLVLLRDSLYDLALERGGARLGTRGRGDDARLDLDRCGTGDREGG